MSDSLYVENFYRKHIRPDRQRSYMLLAKVIRKYFNPKSLVDFGCGSGWLMEHLRRQSPDLTFYGYESSLDALRFADNHVRDSINTDLNFTAHSFMGRRYDIAVSLEVMEHIPGKNALRGITNITRSSDLIFFSAAAPGQGGVGHINEQPWRYWEEMFLAQGFGVDPVSKEIRGYLKKKKAKRWYCNNIRVLRKIQEKEKETSVE